MLDLLSRAHRLPHLICTIAVDEIDGLAPKRDDKSSQSKNDALNMLLALIGGNKDVISLSPEQRRETLVIAKNVLAKLEATHHSALSQNTNHGIFRFGLLPSVNVDLPLLDNVRSPLSNAGLNNTWNDIYNNDGILVSERLDESKTIGTLRATCTIDVPPAILHKLLTKHPEVWVVFNFIM